MNTSSTKSVDALKDQAKALRQKKLAAGEEISHAQALELVAKENGYRDWNTAAAMLARDAVCPVAIGDLVSGTYLKQKFTGRILNVSSGKGHGDYRITMDFDEPVDIITFDSFSVFRKRVTTSIRSDGISPEKTSDGAPHLVLDL